MYLYCITFKLADGIADTGTYEDRYRALMRNIDSVKKGGYWTETTSFILLQSTLSTPDLCAALTKGLSETKDLLVVFDHSDMSLAYFGAISEPEVLGSFFKTRKKIG
jgi:hypothetical protein